MNPDALENVLENKGKKNVLNMIINRTLGHLHAYWIPVGTLLSFPLTPFPYYI